MYYYERKARKEGFSFIIGIDEAGRGPLAGPVVAAAVRCPSFRFCNRINDSKLLSPAQRQKAFLELCQKANIGIGVMNEGVIDSVNILEATRLAMKQAVSNLFYRLKTEARSAHTMLLIDGRQGFGAPYASRCIVDGDAKSFSIAAASIVAKVTRDRIMFSYHQVYPRYAFDKHKGYGTLGHIRALKKYGACPIHRRSFEPLKNSLGNESASS